MLLAAICSFVCLISAMINFLVSPVTDPLSSFREEMLSGARGETVVLSCLLYLSSDILLRTQAIMCFAYGLSDHGWLAILAVAIVAIGVWSTKYAYDKGARIIVKAYGLYAIFFDLIEAFFALTAPRLLFGATPEGKLWGTIGSTTGCVAFLVVSLVFAEGKLQDADFQRDMVGICAGAVVCKFGAFFWCIYPVMSGKYEVLHWLTKDYKPTLGGAKSSAPKKGPELSML